AGPGFPAGGVGLGLAALAWLASDLRAGRTQALTSLPVAFSAVATVEVATVDPIATAVAMLVVAAVFVWSRRPFAALVATGLVPWAVVTGWHHPLAVL